MTGAGKGGIPISFTTLQGTPYRLEALNEITLPVVPRGNDPAHPLRPIPLARAFISSGCGETGVRGKLFGEAELGFVTLRAEQQDGELTGDGNSRCAMPRRSYATCRDTTCKSTYGRLKIRETQALHILQSTPLRSPCTSSSGAPMRPFSAVSRLPISSWAAGVASLCGWNATTSRRRMIGSTSLRDWKWR